MFKWPVVPLCRAQLQDVSPIDILNDGLYRKCNTYKGGGGYDKFPAIFERRFGPAPNLHDQFVVQLAGCPLRCPYCYVTEAGVHGKSRRISTNSLVAAFILMSDNFCQDYVSIRQCFAGHYAPRGL